MVRKNITVRKLSKRSFLNLLTGMVSPMIVAMFFDDSVVRFTDFGIILRRVPSDESLGYFHTIRFADAGEIEVLRLKDDGPPVYFSCALITLENVFHPIRYFVYCERVSDSILSFLLRTHSGSVSSDLQIFQLRTRRRIR